MAFAYAYNGSLTGLQDATPAERICISRAELNKRFYVFNTTQQGDGQAAVNTASKRFVYSIEGTGWYQTSADAGATWDYVHLTDNIGSISGNIFGKTSRAILQRNTVPPERDNMDGLIDVTGVTDSVPETSFELGTLIYHGTLDGYLQSSETPLDASTDQNTSPSTLTLPIGSGTVSATAIVERIGHQPDFRVTGPTPADYSFRYTGTVTATNTPFALNSFTASADLDNGQTIGGTVQLAMMQAHLDYRRGGPVPMRFRGLFSGTVTFT